MRSGPSSGGTAGIPTRSLRQGPLPPIRARNQGTSLPRSDAERARHAFLPTRRHSRAAPCQSAFHRGREPSEPRNRGRALGRFHVALAVPRVRADFVFVQLGAVVDFSHGLDDLRPSCEDALHAIMLGLASSAVEPQAGAGVQQSHIILASCSRPTRRPAPPSATSACRSECR